MKYLIKLKMILGEFEKSSSHLIIAEDSGNAYFQACENESHGSMEYDPYINAWVDEAQFAYKLEKINELTNEEWDFLKKFL